VGVSLEKIDKWEKKKKTKKLLRLLNTNESIEIRSRAIRALASLEDPDIINQLTGLLREPEPEIRLASIETLLDKGSESEQENIRNTLIQITNDIHSTTKNNESATANLAKNFAIHNSTMAIQQMTFNHYMWTHGFNYSTSGNMW
jgi:HEAT repeat protein